MPGAIPGANDTAGNQLRHCCLEAYLSQSAQIKGEKERKNKHSPDPPFTAPAS